ncbi:cell division protein ZapA [Acetobacter sp. AN02]|uniref:cell division protein ZapA n=1 Tax=Acetobacter sp. AN02 TaxID=2894186 RepID=UPI0024344F41|nr:cell division protein ZapA [Acetobacter sp. AN02]MDG6093787.1 cell division protein ZapA [Acetobacter sp. AN02]
MAQVSVRINGYVYTIGCEAGEERHLQSMAHEVEKRVTKVRALGFSGEARVLVLAALLMADEISDMQADMFSVTTTEALASGERAIRENALWKEQLEILADRAETIADALERY